MRKIKLTKEERAIEESLERFVTVDKHEYEQIIHAIVARKKDVVLSPKVTRP